MTGPGHGERSATAVATTFSSILFPGQDVAAPSGMPPFLSDLNLDQVFSAMAASRGAYDLMPFLVTPLSDADVIAFRHEVFRDLEAGPPRQAVDAFAAEMMAVRDHLKQATTLHDQLQRESWFLDAVEIYVGAVLSLTEQLAGLELGSRGLRGLRDYLMAHVESEAFRMLSGESADLKQQLRRVQYTVRMRGNRVTVNRNTGEPDQSREVEAVFERFQKGATKDYRVTFSDAVEMNHVEAWILDRVAQLYADTFSQLRSFCAAHQEFVDPRVGRFDREIQLYLGYLDLIAPLRGAGLSFAYPKVSSTAREVLAEETFDLALAAKLVAERRPVVCNDLHLEPGERIFVVTGPNQGGKTTFARTVGQLHHLGRLGVPVPGRRARLLLCDRVFTHFEKEELVTDLRSRLEDELIRVGEILDAATAHSVVIMNESLASTTVDDALFLGREVLRRLLGRGVIGVYVTFIDELTSVDQGLVSMVSTVFPDDPARRTFKVVRQPADGSAYALAVAEKYGLTFERLSARVRS